MELKYCASLKTNVKSLEKNISCTLIGKDSLPVSVDVIAQWRSRNPKMKVRIPFEITNVFRCSLQCENNMKQWLVCAVFHLNKGGLIPVH